MDWVVSIIPLAVAAAYLCIRRIGQISTRDAAAYAKNGAVIIDVRTEAEYRGGHLPTAINIPHNQIEDTIARYVKDKEHVVLVHCQSGMRSALAKKRLMALGYTKVYNLGSYSRAMHIAG